MRYVIFYFSAVTLFVAAVRAEGLSAVTSPSNYCGLYSVYGAAVALGKPVPFEALLDRKYLSCPQGSSIGELERAVTDHGLHALTLSNMTTATLTRLTSPVILYVRSSLASRNFDHYILYLGNADGKYRCVDEKGVNDLSEAELLSVWSGAGLVVSRAPQSASSVLWREWLGSGVFLAGLLALPLALHFGIERRQVADRQPVLSTYTGAAVFLTVICFTSVLYHRVSAAGLYADGNVTAAVEAVYPSQFMSKLSESDAYAAWQAGDALFVDARTPDAYAEGHIRGATFVDVHASDEHRRARVQGTSSDRRIIVYCQNDGCPYATIIATKLIADGYQNVSIYRDGWDGWRDNPLRQVSHE